MLTEVKGHLINKEEIASISPIYEYDDRFAYMKGYAFLVRFEGGDKIRIEETEFVETPEERREFYKNSRVIRDKVEKLRDMLRDK